MLVTADRSARRLLRNLLWNIFAISTLPLLLIGALLPARRTKLVFGSSPIISNKYWSEALRAAGHDSMTVVDGHFDINREQDFDRYFVGFAPSWLPRRLRLAFGACLALLFVLRNAQVVHMPFSGFALNDTILWRWEARLFRLANIKTIIMPFGADFWMYSRLMDPALRFGLLASYPEASRIEDAQSRRVAHWTRHADAIISGFILDGLGRWDVTVPIMFTIDADEWQPKDAYSTSDGHTGSVKILHTPNHRGFKGTEFVIDAVERLKGEGLQVELVLLERVPNQHVKELMREVDILAEQFIWTGYALSGIEGMASGLPVLANLEHEAYTRVFRRNSFLDECPILSATPENLANRLRLLVINPDLRAALGRSGRTYVEKYHSYEAAQYLFGSVYDRILHGKDIDLMNLFHPLKGPQRRPRVRHPLTENRLRAE
jgi:glycosyltransferase involved in cell wall biosynthesis